MLESGLEVLKSYAHLSSSPASDFMPDPYYYYHFRFKTYKGNYITFCHFAVLYYAGVAPRLIPYAIVQYFNNVSDENDTRRVLSSFLKSVPY